MRLAATALLALLSFTVLAAPAPAPAPAPALKDAPIPGSGADEPEVSDANLAVRDIFTRASNQ